MKSVGSKIISSQITAISNLTKIKKLEILERLTAAEGLEKYLARKYTGVKRFGLEGGESFIPAVHEMVQRAGTHGSKRGCHWYGTPWPFESFGQYFG